MRKLVLAAVLVLMAGGAQAATLNVIGGILHGASNVLVDGKPKALPVALSLIRTLCQKAACMPYTQKPSVPGWGLASLVAYEVDCPMPGNFSDAIQ
jgi:hypothetical protein